MATITRKEGLYSLQFYDPTRTPKRKRVPLRTRTLREAEKLKRRLEDGYAAGEYDPWRTDPLDFLSGRTPGSDGPPTLSEAVAVFLAEKRRILRASTLKTYAHTLGLLAAHAGPDLPLPDLTAEHVYGFLDAREANASGRGTYFRPVRTLVRFYVARGTLRADVTAEVGLPRAPDKLASKLVTRTHLDAFVREANAGRLRYLADVATVGFYLALRRGELCAMRRDWVDLEAGRLTVRQGRGFLTKAGRDAMKAIPRPALDVLRGLCARVESPDDFLILNSAGRPLRPATLSHAFKKVARRAGLPESLSLHGLRHGGITAVVAEEDVEVGRLHAGHASPAQTLRYTHLTFDKYAERLNRAFGDGHVTPTAGVALPVATGASG